MVVLYGATSYTGTLVAYALCARGIRFVAADADRTALEAMAKLLPWRPQLAETEETPEALAALFAGQKLVLNCAAPHLLRAVPIAMAAIRAGAHYADACGELPHLRRLYEHLHGHACRRKLAVVPGAGFEVAPADCAAALLAGSDAVDAVEVFYHFSHMKTSPYTAQGVLKVLQHGGLGFKNGAWRRQRPGRELRTITLPTPPGTRRGISFPSGEIATVPLHVKTRNVQTFLSVPSSVATVAASAAGFLPVLARLGGKRLEELLSLQNRGPSEHERAAAAFVLSVRVMAGAETRQAVLRGRDVYGLTAFILAYVAEQLLTIGTIEGGVLPPSKAVSSVSHFMEALRTQGVFVDTNPASVTSGLSAEET